ncbi:MAG TPA: amidohydrolase family protein [Myxococcota bacterium]|nr:amidohydrolase family protein [Myxococcota bacterium]
MKRIATLFLACAAVATSARAAPPAPEKWTIVQCGSVLLVPGQPPHGETTLVIHDGMIADVLNGAAGPEQVMAGKNGASEVLDLRDRFCMPGLVDLHVHLTAEYTADVRLRRVTEDEAEVALRAALNARKTLEAGFTTVRDLGGSSAVFALRDAIAQGFVPGPRMFVAGYPLTITGGHGDRTTGYREDLFESPGPYQGVADGPYAARAAVRAQVKLGADWIKVHATGGVLDPVASGTDQQFKDDELDEIVSTAHMLGRKVAAHAHGARGVNAALRAGVDTIEHGTFLDAESIELFKKTGAWYVPTIIAGKTVEERAKQPGFFPPSIAAKALAVGPHVQDAVRRALAGGVKVAFGTDAGVYPHGENAREFQYLVEAGMTPAAAIAAATTSAATILGLENEIGTLERGKRADLVATRRNPLVDILELQRILFVMRGGSVYRRE